MSDPVTPPVDDPKPPVQPPTPTPPPADSKPPADPAGDTDWKAEARKWEKRAKENTKAAEELEKVKADAMSEAEKAVAAAKAEGRAEALKESNTALAAARFEAAVAKAGVTLGDAASLIDTSKFLTDKGEVDDDAIKDAVTKLAKLAPKPGAGRSGGEMPGGSGETPKRPRSLHSAVSNHLGGK